jgi:uncharacterized membrane protein YdbT with pleckstrin-like domain
MKDLLPNEEVILSRHQHWSVLIRPLAVPVVVALVALILGWVLGKRTDTRALVFLGVLLVLAVYVSVEILRWRARRYVLTSQRILLVAGLMSRLSKLIFLDRVQDVTTYQSFWARLWGYGNLEVEAAGRDAREMLYHIPNPNQFRNALFAQIQSYRGPSQHV